MRRVGECFRISFRLLSRPSWPPPTRCNHLMVSAAVVCMCVESGRYNPPPPSLRLLPHVILQDSLAVISSRAGCMPFSFVSFCRPLAPSGFGMPGLGSY